MSDETEREALREILRDGYGRAEGRALAIPTAGTVSDLLLAKGYRRIPEGHVVRPTSGPEFEVMVERAARAMCLNEGDDPDTYWTYAAGEARKIVRAALGEG